MSYLRSYINPPLQLLCRRVCGSRPIGHHRAETAGRATGADDQLTLIGETELTAGVWRQAV